MLSKKNWFHLTVIPFHWSSRVNGFLASWESACSAPSMKSEAAVWICALLCWAALVNMGSMLTGDIKVRKDSGRDQTSILSQSFETDVGVFYRWYTINQCKYMVFYF